MTALSAVYQDVAQESLSEFSSMVAEVAETRHESTAEDFVVTVRILLTRATAAVSASAALYLLAQASYSVEVEAE